MSECVICDEPSQVMTCRACRLRVRRTLTNIGRMRRELDMFLEPGRTGSGGKPTGKPGSRPPANLTVIAMTDLRSQRIPDDKGGFHADDVRPVDGELLTIARQIIEDRGLSTVPVDVFDCLRIIGIHVDWKLDQPDVDEFAGILADCATALRIQQGKTEPSLGKCPDIDPVGQADACGGPMRWIDGTTAVACARCGSCWGEQDLPHLLRVMRPAGAFPVPREWVTTRFDVQPSTLRQWVSRGAVRSYHDRQVNLLDVLGRIDDTTRAEGTGVADEIC